MATTSPDNLRTPDPGSPYNLTADLATLANDVQAALVTRNQNVLKGTAAARATAQAAATPGMLWVDTDGIRMIWRRGVSVWEPAVWQWSGTTAQMNTFTQAPNGFVWQSTTNNTPYFRVAGAWSERPLPFSQRARSPYVGGNDGTSNGWQWTQIQQVTFPTPFPTGVVPVISLFAEEVGGLMNVTLATGGVTRTGFSYRVMRLGTAPTGGFLHWTASSPV